MRATRRVTAEEDVSLEDHQKTTESYHTAIRRRAHHL